MKAQSLRERLRESTSTAILDAAEAVGAGDGLSGLTLQAVARGAGIAVGTIYNYFDDRNVLIEALFARRREELYKAIDTAARGHATERFEKQLDAFVRAVLKFFDARRTFLRLALEAAENHPIGGKGSANKRPTSQQLLVHAERVVRVGLKEKRVREEASELFAVMLVGILKHVLVAGAAEDAPLESKTTAITSVFLHGVSK